tara:strand:+ start:3256 stop:4101 length:846 start_codon:yes stop_codon:yes gene_type:complete
MPCGIPDSLLSQFIAQLVGKLEGMIMAKVQKLVNEVQKELQGICPDLSRLKQILKTRDNLVGAIERVERKIEPVNDYAKKLDKPIKAAEVIVLILEQLPIPTTIGTPPTGSPSDVGGTIYSMPTGKINRFGSLLRLACRIIEILKREVKNIEAITEQGLGSIKPTKDKLLSIDLKLFECVDKLDDDEKEQIMRDIKNLPSNIGLLDENDEDPGVYSYSKPGGENYTIKVLDDPDSPSIAKRRFAVVLNESGVIVLRGPKSFSSSTRVLVDEIKFRINNQLP